MKKIKKSVDIKENNGSFSLYVHWPFCLSKCPYCDFNSHVSGDPIDTDRWKRAFLEEMGRFAAEIPQKTLKTMFFGGGTPSIMSPGMVFAAIEAAKGFWRASKDLEVTLEANPTSVESGKLRAFAAAGVNRCSLGIQSLNNKSLKFLGRNHSAEEGLAAISLAREHFERVSFDLIYGLPGQALADWKTELNQAIKWAGGHLSLYQLSVEKGTAFYRDGVAEADPDLGADLFKLTHELMSLSGFNNYEISNYAKLNQECRHNLEIWRGGDYAGIGPGAHGRLSSGRGVDALVQMSDPDRWLRHVESDGHGTAKRRRLEIKERAEEMLMTGLRLTEGVSGDTFESRSGLSLSQCVDDESLRRLVEGGFMEVDEDGIRATLEGRLRLNAVLAELLVF